MKSLQKDLEDALRRARGDADHFKKQLTEAHRVAMSQASVAASVHAATSQAGYLDGTSNSGQVAGPSTSPSPGSSEIGQHTSSSAASSMTVLPGGGASGGGQ